MQAPTVTRRLLITIAMEKKKKKRKEEKGDVKPRLLSQTKYCYLMMPPRRKARKSPAATWFPCTPSPRRDLCLPGFLEIRWRLDPRNPQPRTLVSNLPSASAAKPPWPNCIRPCGGLGNHASIGVSAGLPRYAARLGRDMMTSHGRSGAALITVYLLSSYICSVFDIYLLSSTHISQGCWLILRARSLSEVLHVVEQASDGLVVPARDIAIAITRVSTALNSLKRLCKPAVLLPRAVGL